MPPLPAGQVDEPFRGVVGGGLTGGGANWRFKLPLDLEETIPNSAALPRMVIRLPHNAIEEVATGRRWQRVENDWVEMEEAAREPPQESRGAVNKVAREKQEKWRAAEQERSAAAPATAPAVSPDSVEKERLVLKRTKATAKGSKLRALCHTATPGGKLAATCLGWGLPIATVAPTPPPPTVDPLDPFADIEDAAER